MRPAGTRRTSAARPPHLLRTRLACGRSKRLGIAYLAYSVLGGADNAFSKLVAQPAVVSVAAERTDLNAAQERP